MYLCRGEGLPGVGGLVQPDAAPSQGSPRAQHGWDLCSSLCRLTKQSVALKCLGTIGRILRRLPHTLLGGVWPRG